MDDVQACRGCPMNHHLADKHATHPHCIESACGVPRRLHLPTWQSSMRPTHDGSNAERHCQIIIGVTPRQDPPGSGIRQPRWNSRTTFATCTQISQCQTVGWRSKCQSDRRDRVRAVWHNLPGKRSLFACLTPRNRGPGKPWLHALFNTCAATRVSSFQLPRFLRVLSFDLRR